MLKRIIFWTIIAITTWVAHSHATDHIEKHIRNEIEIPRGNIIVVDQNSSSPISNGSFEHPLKSIEEALIIISEHDEFETIFVYDGEYLETIVLPDNINLFGIGDNIVIKNPEGTSGETVTPGNNTLLSNIKILEGKYGLYIPRNTGPVTLLNCSVESAGKWGIYNEKHEDAPETKLSLIGSTVTKNERQGLYLQKGYFYMNRSKANENGEEGIDLHIDMKIEIKNSEVVGNGEGGLETELGNIDLKISNNIFKNSGSSGINLQSFGDKSKVLIKNNTIEENENFGVRCAIHTKEVAPYFSRMITIENNNTFNKNGKENIDPNCKF